MSKNNEVLIINRKNHLKEKVVRDTDSASMGAKGMLDPEAIKRAQKVIDNSQESYKEELSENLDELVICWKELKENTGDEKQKRADFHRISNHIADVAGTFGFDLMAFFGKSLRDFNDTLVVNDNNHTIIVQAHIDVMMIAYQKDLRAADSAQARELMTVVSKAIQKYS